VILTVKDLEMALTPIHEALGSIMESIMALTRVISGLRPETVPSRTAVGTTAPDTTGIVEHDRDTLLKALINPKTGKFTGVYPVNNRWQARIGAQPIGYWDTAEEAALARHVAKTTGVTPRGLPAKPAVGGDDLVRLERERRKTLEAVEQKRAEARREELLLKNEAKLRETLFKNEAKLQEAKLREQLKVDGDLARIQERGRLRNETLQLRDDIVSRRKRKDDDADKQVIKDLNNGWYPGKDVDAKTPDQIAAEMSDWPDPIDPTDPDEN
jgi:hypothetical protein